MYIEATVQMEAPPVLSTPDARILEATSPVTSKDANRILSDDELSVMYDIERTLEDIRQARYERIALQFPDEMLPDAPRVFQLLSRGLRKESTATAAADLLHEDSAIDLTSTDGLVPSAAGLSMEDSSEWSPKLYILADTSYGTCCVDEVAAEHVNADVVVHYGRSCLSPTARLPVIYVFTQQPLQLDHLVRVFKDTYPDLTLKVILAADVTYSAHVLKAFMRLKDEGYTSLFATEIVHDPASAIPNRTLPDSLREAPETLSEWQLFHISDPPTALLLTLASRVASIHIYPTDVRHDEGVKPLSISTAAALRRRYAMLTKLSTVPIFGILINTLSVKNYLHIVNYVKTQIAVAGKKSYMFVVGKLNAAKVANFSEIGGWVVIGCWESSLVDSKDFWRPVITPFELELALQGDASRVWTGAWQSNFQSVLDRHAAAAAGADHRDGIRQAECIPEEEEEEEEEEDDPDDAFGPESQPPEFDLHTGRYVWNTRPMRHSAPRAVANPSPWTVQSAGKDLAKRGRNELATIRGTLSPGAEFLHSQRTWKGLGSDFEIAYDEDDRDSTLVVEGRKGIARGYTVGESVERR